MDLGIDFLNPDGLERRERLCKGLTHLMYADTHLGVKAAKALCRQCASVTPCLRDAVAHEEEYGVWGGTSARERAVLIRLKRKGQWES